MGECLDEFRAKVHPALRPVSKIPFWQVQREAQDQSKCGADAPLASLPATGSIHWCLFLCCGGLSSVLEGLVRATRCFPCRTTGGAQPQDHLSIWQQSRAEAWWEGTENSCTAGLATSKPSWAAATLIARPGFICGGIVCPTASGQQCAESWGDAPSWASARFLFS